MTTIEINPAVALCVERAAHHQQLAASASTDDERRAHEATMRSLDKAALELVKGNAPRYTGSGVWLVESRTQANTVYRVDLGVQMCSCKNARNCWHLAAANICDELRTMPADVLPVMRPDDEIESELDALIAAEALAGDAGIDLRGVYGADELPEAPTPNWTTVQRGRQWVVVNPARFGVSVNCSSETDAELIAGVLNGYGAGDALTRNGTLLISTGFVIGVASSPAFGEEIERAWASAFAPF